MTREIRTVGIIGGGVAGLAAGIRLARHGLQVQLFEARPKLGGCCASTTLSGYTFNDGALYLAMPSILDHAFAQLGLNRSEVLPLVRITAPQTSYLPDGTRVVFGDGQEVRVLHPDGAVGRVDLSGLMERWNPVLQVITRRLALEPLSFARFLALAWRFLPRLRGNVAGELGRLFADENVRSAMAGMLLYAGQPAARLPNIHMLGLACLFADGFHLPAQGMGQIPYCLGGVLRAAGGAIHLNCGASRIALRQGRAAALVFADGESVPVDAIVSTVSGMHTARLLGDAVPRRMRSKSDHAPLSHRAVAVQLGLRQRLDVSSQSFSVLPMLRDQQRFFEPAAPEPLYYHCNVPTVTLPDLAPAGASVLEIFPPIRQDLPPDAWDDRALAAVADGAVNALGHRYNLDVAVRRVTGPVQYRDHLGLFEGAVYGLSPAADVRALFEQVTAVRGLYQAGQSTYPGYGVVSAIMSGLFAADALLARRL